MRGEYEYICEDCMESYGSSPHAWGILLFRRLRNGAVRFIPTCVGNTQKDFKFETELNGSSPHAWGILWCCSLMVEQMTVHPHMRGEYNCAFVAICVGYGSSPHAWGIPTNLQHIRVCSRFIPTCVGNTLTYPEAPDQPTGSSPHAWGILHIERPNRQSERFIPTCVGNTAA